jgi:outer membrane receptor protein involved in Fe transport
MAIVMAALFLLAAPEAEVRISGRVVDSRGAAVSGASITIQPSGVSTATDARGDFAVDVPAVDRFTVVVEAAGFARSETSYAAGDARRGIEIRLARGAYTEQVSVTAARSARRLSETPESTVVLGEDEIAASAAPVTDQILREVPGFALFRRSDSRTANPTTQGVSLRGVGGSGASRAVVLDDGIPLNDPFGGWVYWSRIPALALERAEVVRGGMSALYGPPALSGAIELFRRESLPDAALFEGSWGTHDTPQASLFAAGRLGRWGARLAAEKYRTSGYVPVAREERGPVDREANSRHEALDVTLDRTAGADSRFFLRAATFDEARRNGTALQVNDTRLRQVAAGADASGRAGDLRVRAFLMDETYHQTFSAISLDRTAETLTRAQRVPSTAGGLSVQWSKGYGAHRLVAGFDGREVHASDEEDVFGARGATFSGANARQQSGAVFLEDLWTANPRLTIDAGVRADGWRNFDAELSRGPTQPEAFARPLPDRSETAVSPRASALYRLAPAVALTAAGYRSFRAPTANELYRTFRVGNVVTDANENLTAERASGGEIGAILTPAGERAILRANVYWTEIQDTIANVTISSTPELVTRRRENLGRTRARGIELDWAWRASDALAVSGGYLYADSTVERFPVEASLEGKRIPQVPRHQGSLQVRYGRPGGLLLAVQAQLVGRAYEDDQNALPLSGYADFDARASVPVTPAVDVFVAAENLFDRRYEVGRTPVRSLAPPRSVRGGVRVHLD